MPIALQILTSVASIFAVLLSVRNTLHTSQKENRQALVADWALVRGLLTKSLALPLEDAGPEIASRQARHSQALLEFAPSIMPVAQACNLPHYFSILVQLEKIAERLAAVSDGTIDAKIYELLGDFWLQVECLTLGVVISERALKPDFDNEPLMHDERVKMANRKVLEYRDARLAAQFPQFANIESAGSSESPSATQDEAMAGRRE